MVIYSNGGNEPNTKKNVMNRLFVFQFLILNNKAEDVCRLERVANATGETCVIWNVGIGRLGLCKRNGPIYFCIAIQSATHWIPNNVLTTGSRRRQASKTSWRALESPTEMYSLCCMVIPMYRFTFNSVYTRRYGWMCGST